MMAYPYILLFLSTLFLSTFVGISSRHLFIVWISFELNILSFIPIISFSSWFQETESCIKYFIFQAFGSSILLLGSLNRIVCYRVIFGLLVKLGVAPFHFWFPSVISGCSWFVCGLLITWQKVLPLFLIVYCFDRSYSPLVLVCGAIRSLVGGLGGLNQTQLRPLLGYSSIGHIGWILCGRYYSKVVGIVYFFFYFLISLCVVWLFIYIMYYSLSISIRGFRYSYLISFLVLGLFLSLGGVPPLTGFFPKWIIISLLDSFSLLFFLLVGSLINLYYYLNVCFSIFICRESRLMGKRRFSVSSVFILFCFLSIFSFPLLWYALVLFY